MEETSVIGYWFHEIKRPKLNLPDFEKKCKKQGFTLKSIDLNKNFESQGPFNVLLHRFCDFQAHADAGDPKAQELMDRIENYIAKHPEMVVIDPLDKVRILGNRRKFNEILQREIHLNDVFVPKSIELKSKNKEENLNRLQQFGIKFPFVCKPLLAYGSSGSQQMKVIFNEDGLNDCQSPCIAQEFINHNAILYKIYIVCNDFHVVTRPSLKNFYLKDCESKNTLFYSSASVLKSEFTSEWSAISKEEEILSIKPNNDIFKKIVNITNKMFGVALMGIDVIIENHTGKYAIVDVNYVPKYLEWPTFDVHLIENIKLILSEHRAKYNQLNSS